MDASFVRLVTNRPVEQDLRRRITGGLSLLISIGGEQPGALDLLDTVIGGLDGTDYELTAASVGPPWWLAHGVAPRPCIEVLVHGVVESTLDEPDLVLAVDVDASDLDRLGGRRTLRGQVVSDSGSPVVGARVTIDDAPHLSTRTDSTGAFAIAAVLTRSTVPVTFRVGRITRTVDLAVDRDNPPVTLIGPTSRA